MSEVASAAALFERPRNGLRDLEELHACVDEELDKQVSNWSIVYQAAVEMSELNTYEASSEARKILEASVARGYKLQSSLLQLARCNFDMGCFVEARKAIDLCLSLDPLDAKALAFKKKIRTHVWSESKELWTGIVGTAFIFGLITLFATRGNR